MPIYEYRRDGCNARVDVLVRSGESRPSVSPSCCASRWTGTSPRPSQRARHWWEAPPEYRDAFRERYGRIARAVTVWEGVQ
jgi:hypothetical protein